MGLPVVSDGALGGSPLPAGGAGGWLTSSVVRGELVLSRACDIAAAVRGCFARLASRSRAAHIHVPAMSDTWLEMHATEYDKHRVEF